jgi:hypothetical protein
MEHVSWILDNVYLADLVLSEHTRKQYSALVHPKVRWTKYFYPTIRFRSEYDTIGTSVKAAAVYLGTALVKVSNQSRILIYCEI